MKSRAHALRPLPNIDEVPDHTLLTDTDVSAITTFSIASLKAWRRTDKGPKFVVINGSVRYRAGDVRAWINAAASTPRPKQRGPGRPKKADVLA